MITFIEKHFRGLVILLLLILCLLLYTGRNNGRYMLCPALGGESIFVLDTKTSKLWIRYCNADFDSKKFGLVNISLGTNKNPQVKIIKKVGDIGQ